MPVFLASRSTLRRSPGNDCQILASMLGVVPGFYDVRYNVGLNGAGRVLVWDDARWPGRGPQLVAGGTNLPTFALNGAGITTDGVATTGNFLRSALTNGDFQPSPGMTLIHIGAMAGANFGIILSNNAQTQYISDCCNGGNIQNIFSRDLSGTQQSVASAIAGSATMRLSISAVSTNPNIGSQTTPYFFNEVGGRLRKLDTTGAWPALAGTQYRLNIGINQPGTAWSAFSTRALILVKGDLSREQILAVKAWADAYHGPTYNVRRAAHFVGDSLTFGTNASNQATTSYPGVVMAQTTPVNMTTLYDGANLGVGGRTAFHVKNLLGYNVLPNINTFRVKDVVFVWIGTNDIAQSGLTPAQVEGAIVTIAQQLKAAGAVVVGVPPIPREDVGVTSGQLANLKTLSDWFQAGASGAGFDDITPLWNNALFNTWTFGSSSAQNATNYAADKVHLTDAGYASIATDATNGIYTHAAAGGLL